MIKWYCEDGNDNWIEIFNTKKEAKAYAEENEKVLEIHKYNYIFKKGSRELEDIEHLGCVWMKPGWDGFVMKETTIFNNEGCPVNCPSREDYPNCYCMDIIGTE